MREDDMTRASPRPFSGHSVSRRALIGGGYGLLVVAAVVVLFVSGSLAFARGDHSWYAAVALIAFLAIFILQNLGLNLNTAYLAVHYYRLPGPNVGVILLAVLASCFGGWLLLKGHTLVFRFVACVPALALANTIGRWLLAAPDSRDDSGKLKFGTRSALIGLYLAMLSFAFTLASVIVTELQIK